MNGYAESANDERNYQPDVLNGLHYSGCIHEWLRMWFGTITSKLTGAPLFGASEWSAMLGCDTKSHEYLSRSSIEDLVFCHQYPTGTCAGSNPGVRSSRD